MSTLSTDAGESRISCTVPSYEAASASARPPAVSNASMSCALPSPRKPSSPSAADVTASSVPLPCTRISCTPLPSAEVTTEKVRPPIVKKSEPLGFQSLSKPSCPAAADPAPSIVPLS